MTDLHEADEQEEKHVMDLLRNIEQEAKKCARELDLPEQYGYDVLAIIHGQASLGEMNMQEMTMNHWAIPDKRVVEAIRANGFVCEHPKPEPVQATISFHFQTPKEEQAVAEANIWYDTNCPVQWNERYTLLDGTVIRASGTEIVFDQ